MLLSLSNIQYLSSYKPSPSSSSKYKFKVCIIGNSCVGKTSLIYRAKKNAFVQTITTVGYDVIKLYFKLPNEEICELHLWDTCDKKRIKQLIPYSIRMLLWECSCTPSQREIL